MKTKPDCLVMMLLTALWFSAPDTQLTADDSANQWSPNWDNAKRMESLPALDSHLPLASLGIDIDELSLMVLTHPAQFRKSVLIQVDSIKYELGISDSGEVRYIATHDEVFITADSLTLSSDLQQCRNSASGDIYKLLGWGYVLPLASGWNAAWCVGRTCTDEPPADSTTVGWFFRGGN